MAKAAIECANLFISHLRYVEPTRKKMETSLVKGGIVRRDIEQIYRGIFLEMFCSFERFLEDLFIGLLSNTFVHPSTQVVPKVVFNSSIVARNIVFGGRKYVDWLPYNQTKDRAEVFFRNGLPFMSLEESDKNLISKICVIRNAFAHKSHHAHKVFETEVIGAINLSPRERNPAGFLRSQFRISPTQTRYENLIIEMSTIATKLCL